MKRLSMILFFGAITFLSYAQEAAVKPDCKPKSCSLKDKKACSPGDTKVGEAKVIKDLRIEIQELSLASGNSKEIAVGKTDDESLNILVEEMDLLIAGTDLSLPSENSSNAEKVASLRKLVEQLKTK